MLPLSMTLNDLSLQFQGHNIFWRLLSEKWHVLKTKIIIAQEETIPNIWNGTVCLVTLTDLQVRRAGLSASVELLVLFTATSRPITIFSLV